MSEDIITCAACGRQLPGYLARRRDEVECACGMRIQSRGALVATSRVSALAFLLLAAAIVLLTAVAALARRLVG